MSEDATVSHAVRSVEEGSTSQQSPASLSAAIATVSQALQRTNIECTFKHQAKDKYTFWETQPVTQFREDGTPIPDGPIDVPKSISDVRQDPYNLPDSFVWSICDLADAAQVHEVYELLSNNYVEDDDNMFRFNYSPAFLKWALQPPGHKPEWLLGVRVASNHKLVGFISAVPAHIRPTREVIRMVEINFLCVHKKLRAKRLAPVLIKEITRRVNLHGIWQAAYTAGVLIPKPIATCRYWHRSLNPKKLIDIGFSRLAPRMTMVRTIKLYKVPDVPLTPGLRAMTARDVPAVVPLLNKYLAGFKLAQVFDEEEAAHWFTPQENVVDAYVVEDPVTGAITDMLSFYTLPSTILGHPEHTPESPLSVHKSTYSVAYGERRYTNDLLTAALDSGDVSPVTSQQFLGNHFKDETRIKRVVAEALYAAYIVEWEVNFKPLRVGGGLGWNLDQLLHREPGTGPTVHFDPKRRRSLVKLQPAAKKWEAKIWVVDSAPEDDWEMERVCWVKQSSGGGGGRSAFTRRELELWAGDRFLIRNSGYKMYLEMFARWMAELAAPQL
ncbi:MAG: hypothetical protein WDW38_007169 [Sanguina aurantia]